MASVGRGRSFNGQRITAARWDAKLPPAEAAKRASRAIGWPELRADAVWLAALETSLLRLDLGGLDQLAAHRDAA